jgi:hypothetical protein
MKKIKRFLTTPQNLLCELKLILINIRIKTDKNCGFFKLD